MNDGVTLTVGVAVAVIVGVTLALNVGVAVTVGVLVATGVVVGVLVCVGVGVGLTLGPSIKKLKSSIHTVISSKSSHGYFHPNLALCKEWFSIFSPPCQRVVAGTNCSTNLIHFLVIFSKYACVFS